MFGTPNYIAPEIVKNIGHSYECDIWSSGIVLYLMLIKHHRPPFETGDINKTMKRVRDENVKITKCLSPECQDFLSFIFIKKRKHRRKMNDELAKHKWLQTKLNLFINKSLSIKTNKS